MASSNDLIKYFTEEVVRFLDTPKQSRQKKVKEPISYQWFGFIPFALKMILHKLELQLRKLLRLFVAGIRYIVTKVNNVYSNTKK